MESLREISPESEISRQAVKMDIATISQLSQKGMERVQKKPDSFSKISAAIILFFSVDKTKDAETNKKENF